ncbi:hypothetical protein QLL95_gp0192 [Cotonvirus japonicus]|uniref:Ankyrin repeat protein n=1 Tax=Cotonvirus japonicus TaxID=2811091 RepID=A0ABM7NR98_9VIRU|nr:hypothetical protein QLL95_gp0192 [Cotonvirus japonicus]BCS82681.1 hypothetical protein [Cotonvirus japonicus]
MYYGILLKLIMSHLFFQPANNICQSNKPLILPTVNDNDDYILALKKAYSYGFEQKTEGYVSEKYIGDLNNIILSDKPDNYNHITIEKWKKLNGYN